MAANTSNVFSRVFDGVPGLSFTIYQVQSMDDLDHKACINVQLLPDSERCTFVEQVPDCLTESSFVPYLHLLFCDFDSSSRYLGVLICVVWLVLMFFLLGKSANDFFCPALTVIARALGLSENLAGVTILAFGNGSPDIFTSLVGVPRGRSQLIYGELIGSGLFVTTVIAGSICTLRPFSLMDRPFLRDVIFYLGAAYWTFYIFYKGAVTTWEAIGFILLYVVYITVVLAERMYSKQPPLSEMEWKNTEATLIEESTPCTSTSNISGTRTVSPSVRSLEASTRSLPETPRHSDEDLHRVAARRARSCSVNTIQDLAIHHERLQLLWAQGLEEELRREKQLEENVVYTCSSDENASTPDEATPLFGVSTHASSRGKCHRLWHEMRDGLSVALPWQEEGAGLLSIILALLQLPVVLVLKLLIPVVNYTVPRHAWCKTLNALHCITCPLFCVLATQVAGVQVAPYLPIWLLICLIGSTMAVLVLLTSRHDRPPSYHVVFAFLGFAGSVVTIYMVANEVVNLLRAIGILSRMSDTMLGMTVLAWGNSIGDFITNFSIARQGYERMGFSACYGGPLFNILLGIGISFTMATVASKDQRIVINYGEVGPLLVFFLGLSLLSSLVAFPLMGFKTRRTYGFYLLGLYLVFLVSATLLELGALPFALLPTVTTPSTPIEFTPSQT